jgi:hypothetical protein
MASRAPIVAEEMEDSPVDSNSAEQLRIQQVVQDPEGSWQQPFGGIGDVLDMENPSAMAEEANTMIALSVKRQRKLKMKKHKYKKLMKRTRNLRRRLDKL